MAEADVREVLQAAQAALEENRPTETIATCQHVQRSYPDAITALRLLGEAYLEVRRPDDARRAFERVLALDPLNVLARIGLAVIAEDHGEDERAIVQFRLAWEIDPLLPQLRGELTRLYRKRYGATGRLRLTRPALAMLYGRNDDLVRAIREFRALHAEQSGRVDLTLGLIQILWRRGDDQEAARLCQQVLAERPQTARALLILADLLGESDADQARRLQAARQLDPDAELARTLHSLRPTSTVLERYIATPLAEGGGIPAFDAGAAILGREALTPGRDTPSGGPTTATGALGWEAIAAGFAGPTTTPPAHATVNGAAPPTAPVATDAAPSFDWPALPDEEHAPETPEPPTGAGETIGVASAPGARGWTVQADSEALLPAPDEPDAVTRLTANWDQIDAELAAATPRGDADLSDPTLLGALGDVTPFSVDAPNASVTAPFTEPADQHEPVPNPAELGLDTDLQPFRLDQSGTRTNTITSSFADLFALDEELTVERAAPEARPLAAPAAPVAAPDRVAEPAFSTVSAASPDTLASVAARSEPAAPPTPEAKPAPAVSARLDPVTPEAPTTILPVEDAWRRVESSPSTGAIDEWGARPTTESHAPEPALPTWWNETPTLGTSEIVAPAPEAASEPPTSRPGVPADDEWIVGLPARTTEATTPPEPTPVARAAPPEAPAAEVWDLPGATATLPEPAPIPTPPAPATTGVADLAARVAAAPDDVAARLALAAAYADERPEQALAEYRRAIKAAIELPPDAIAGLQRMIAAGRGGARAHRVLGEAYLKLGRYDLATAEFQRALAGRTKR